MTERIRYQAQLFICSGKSCSEKSDPDAAKKYFKSLIKEKDLKAQVRACTCSCLDYCEEGPNMVLYPEGRLYKSVTEKDWKELANALLLQASDS